MTFYPRIRSSVSIDVESYLRRIDCPRKEPSLKFLKRLHRQHLLKVPYENLDIHYGHRIELSPKSLFKKIVLNGRGGICYELNILFYYLLQNLGYQCYLVAVQTLDNKTWSHEYEHIAIICEVDSQKWLCDVGFGSHFINPLKLIVEVPQIDFTRYFKFGHDPDKNYLLKKSSDNSYFDTVYRFTDEPKEMIQFLERCNFHQDSIDSAQKKQKYITLLTDIGRVTLTERKLNLLENGVETEYEILNQDEFHSHIENHFNIDSIALFQKRV